MAVRVQREDFDIGAELAALTRDRHDIGAVTSFVGLVRDIAGDAKIGAMTLEHYPGMTQKELARVEAECDWSDALVRLAEVLAAAQAERPSPGTRRPVD
jgi:molybdopterin synthase catalytic subunit